MKNLSMAGLQVVATVLVLTLAGCGGGGGGIAASPDPAPSSAGGVPTVVGTVTGFGSVVVDGVRIDDRNVAAGVERDDGNVEAAELQLGQHVEVQHDGKLLATAIRIRSEVEGTVEKVDVAGASLTVMGQTITVNTNATLGPVTVFSAPYAKLADVAVQDLVEVHALLKTDAAGKASMQATRIQKKTSESSNRVKGIVKNLTATTFALGNLTINYADAKIRPAANALVSGATVYVSTLKGEVTSGATVKATLVKVKDVKTESGDQEAGQGGVISKWDATTKTFVLDGRTVDASNARLAPATTSFADLKDGLYVRVIGTYKADGSVLATVIVLRASEHEVNQDIELHGTVLNFKSMQDFTLRGQAVDASEAKIDVESCGAITTLKDGLQVDVRGSLTATGKVMAVRVKCEKTEDGNTVVERQGKVSNVNLTAKTFTLTTVKETITVQWSSLTLFVKLDSAALDGKTLEVEGRMVAGVLQAFKVIQD